MTAGIETRPPSVARFYARGRCLAIHPVTADRVEAAVDGVRVGLWHRALAVQLAIDWQLGTRAETANHGRPAGGSANQPEGGQHDE